MASRGASPPRIRIAAAALALVAVAALVAGCGANPPTSDPSASGAPSSPTASTPGTARPSASAKPGTSAAPTASPSPTLPPIVGATQIACPGSSGGSARGKVVAGQSRNWAGYIAGGSTKHVTCVEGTWTQPKVRCPASGQTSVAIWVGIDGSSPVGGLPDASATLAQTGTVGDCVNGQAQYGAWYEFLPDLRHMESFRLSVAAGDKIWAQVLYTGKGKFTATLINLTQRIGITQNWNLRLAPLLTAEWVVEEPAANCSGGSCTFVTLAKFSKVTLNGAVSMGSHRYPLSSIPYLYLRTTINRSGKTLASPSTLSSKGFTVTWKSS
jgi:hypothetical protein